MDPSHETPEGRAHARAHAIREASDLVGRDARGRDVPEVMERLSASLAERHVFLPPSFVEMHARALVRRRWDFLHPLRVMREFNVLPTPGIDDEWNAGERALVREQRAAMERLDHVIRGPNGLRECSVATSRTVTGLSFTVKIRPYDEATARTVVEALAPVPSTVGPITP